MQNAFEDVEVDPDRAAEYAETPGDEPLEEVTEEQVDSVMSEPSRSQTSYDALDLECEKRFEVAMYYRTLLKGKLFNENTEASSTVENEARAFFKERLETLLGIRAPKPVAATQVLPFDKEEIAALKAVARRLVKKPELIEAKPVQPTLRQAAVPAPIKPRSAAPSPKPVRPTPPAAKTTVAPTKGGENEVVENTGKTVRQGHKVYRVVKNELGTEFKQDITRQGHPVGMLPMPQGEMLGQVTAIQAGRQIDKLDIQVKGHHVGVAQLVNKVSQEE